MIATVDVLNDPGSIDDQCRGMGNIESILSDPVIQTISLGDRAILVEQARERDGIFEEMLLGVKEAMPLLRREIEKLRLVIFNVSHQRLKLGHAFYAVGSPRAAQKFENDRALRNQLSQGKHALAVRRRNCKLGRGRSNAQCLGAIEHPISTVEQP